MTDIYVYYYRRIALAGPRVLSTRRATLSTINELDGDPVMASPLIVDRSEVDADGFVIGHDTSNPIDRVWAQLRSFERRAQARDNEALRLDKEEEAQGRYQLSLESRELRRQAQALRRQRIESMARDLGYHMDSGTFMASVGPAPESAGRKG